jgi:L,D-transpeptidase YcbB
MFMFDMSTGMKTTQNAGLKRNIKHDHYPHALLRLPLASIVVAFTLLTPSHTHAEDLKPETDTSARTADIIDIDKGQIITTKDQVIDASTPPSSPPASSNTSAATPSAPSSPPEDISTVLAEYGKTPLPRAGAYTKRVFEDIIAFYAHEHNAPLWNKDGHWTQAARDVRAQLDRASDDALDLHLTPPPDLTDNASLRAKTEVQLTLAVVNYARQASGARIDPRSIAETITQKPEIADVATVLTTLPQAEHAGDALAAFNPQQPAYQALRTKLAEIRRTHPKANTQTLNISGPVLRMGMSDERVPLIRVRLGLKDDHADQPTHMIYDARLASAIANFQRSSGLPPTGTLTARTAKALSQNQADDLEADLISNMEMWRWMPHQLGENHIEVNIADFTVRVMRGTTTVLQSRVVVGKPTTPTPIFSNVMQFLIINPYWNVPPSIIKKEMLPRLAEDPNYLHKLGYEVIKSKNRLIVRQPPGERNALGRIKFMFPNDHAVYLHDTPQRGFFAANERAFSHGCVRVDQPLHLAEIVLGPDQGWSEERVKKMIGGAEKTVHLPQPLPIHIGYFTTFFDDNGQLQKRKDIYGYEQKIRAALGLNS